MILSVAPALCDNLIKKNTHYLENFLCNNIINFGSLVMTVCTVVYFSSVMI